MKQERLAPKILYWFAIIWLSVAGVLIVSGYVSILYYQGFWKLQETLNPFNIWNYLAVFITLGPGLGAWFLAKKLRKENS